jgi:hypothetical protein
MTTSKHVDARDEQDRQLAERARLPYAPPYVEYAADPQHSAVSPTAGRASGRPKALCADAPVTARLIQRSWQDVDHGQAVAARS